MNDIWIIKRINEIRRLNGKDLLSNLDRQDMISVVGDLQAFLKGIEYTLDYNDGKVVASPTEIMQMILNEIDE